MLPVEDADAPKSESAEYDAAPPVAAVTVITGIDPSGSKKPRATGQTASLYNSQPPSSFPLSKRGKKSRAR